MVNLGLLSNIYEIWQNSGFAYGVDRVHQQLRRDGTRIGRKRVERLMRGQGWQGAHLRRGWRGGSTKQDPGSRAGTGSGEPPVHRVRTVSATPPGSCAPRACSGSPRFGRLARIK
ncbi:IS3 family transposase [Actinoplanes sp. NPDC024001]|uniref:IS3 family transposase n=1 Tax=Actinoplanes sp. NPDC024001 TaxID=3154598 RepID=UPI00341140BD